MTTLSSEITHAATAFAERFGYRPDFTAYAPGRINIIGEHTDYNGGLAMPVAINRWVCVSLRPRPDRVIRFYSKNFEQALEFDLSAVPESGAVKGWQKYVLGAMHEFMGARPLASGFDALIRGNVPLGMGLSSSAALTVALLTAFRRLTSQPFDDYELCNLSQQVEHRHLGVPSGLLDQWASVFSKPGECMLIDFRQQSFRHFHADLGHFVWALVDSGVKRELAASKYAERVRETAAGMALLQERFPEIQNFRDITREHLKKMWQFASPETASRLTHFLDENERVLEMLQFLQNGDFKRAGLCLYASHLSLRDNYEVSCRELDFLAESATDSAFCAGARMMGGGFGGCTLNLVQKSSAKRFLHGLVTAYSLRFNIDTEGVVVAPVGGAGIETTV